MHPVGPAIGTIVVASWYPSASDPIRGRFVADQVRGITGTGGVRARVVSFELARLSGDPPERARQLAAVRAVTTAASRDPALFRRRAWSSPPDVPVARLPIPFGWVSREDEPDRAAGDRIEALARVAERVRVGLPSRALVHAQTAYPDGAAAANLAARLGLPLVITEHAAYVDELLADDAKRPHYLAAVRAAARFVAVSETLAAELRRAVPELEEKLVVIPNAVATDEFALVEPAARDPNELLYVGYRRESKGMALLLDAFALIRAQRPQMRLRLVGQAPSPAVDREWQERAAGLGIGDAITFDGPADRAGVVEAMARAALFVHPSPRETFGVVAVEALATGLPIVATDSGGVTEILDSDAARVGGLVRSREPDALAAAVLDALDRREGFDPGVLRATVEARFGVASVSRRLLDLYEAVLAERNGGRAASPGSAAAPSDSLGADVESAVVVATDRAAARAALTPLPRALLRRTTVVTVPDPRRRLPEDLHEVFEIDPEAEFRRHLGAAGGGGPRGGPARRVLRVVRDPLGPLRRRRVRARRQAILDAAPQVVVRRAAAAAARGRRQACVVALSGRDFEIVSPLIGDPSVRMAPGGLRWLADADAGDE